MSLTIYMHVALITNPRMQTMLADPLHFQNSVKKKTAVYLAEGKESIVSSIYFLLTAKAG